MRISQFLTNNALIRADQTALVWEGRALSWCELDVRVTRLGNALIRLGISPGDAIVLIANNRPEWIELYLAASRIGAIVVPMMPKSVAREVAHIMRDTSARVLVYAEGLLPEGPLSAWLPEDLLGIVCLDGGAAAGAMDYEEWVRSAPTDEIRLAVDSDTVASIKYTSGTTGVPKGCCRTHRQVVTAALLYHANFPHLSSDRATISSPLAAGMAVALLNTFVLAGVTMYLLPKFDPVRLLTTIERERITLAYAILSTFDEFTQHPDLEAHDLSSLRLFTGSSANQATLRGMQRLRSLPGFRAGFLNAYGSTEAGGYIAYNLPQDYEEIFAGTHAEHRVDSVGRPGALCQIECLDENMNVVAPGEPGEMAVRTPTAFNGYMNRPEESAAVFRDGWLMTGDMAYKDDAGYVFLAGRKRDMIKTGGVNVYPAEIESLLAENPKIVEVAVVGLPDAEWGEKVVACVVSNAPLTFEEIADFCKDRLAGYKRPKALFVMDSIPKNETGKVLKRELREGLLKYATV